VHRLLFSLLFTAVAAAGIPRVASASVPGAHSASTCVVTITSTPVVGSDAPDAAASLVLGSGSVYIAPAVIKAGHAAPPDINMLERVAGRAACRSITVKFALLPSYPKHFRTEQQAADGLAGNLGLSGVLILVTRSGLAVSSDLLSGRDETRLKQRAQPLCAESYARCAAVAAQASIPLVLATEASATRNVEIFWAVALAVFGVVIAALVLLARRRQARILATWHADDAAGSA